MSDDDTRPDFGALSRSLGQFRSDAEKSIERQVAKKKAKTDLRPSKFCDICEVTFDYRKKSIILVAEGHEAPIKEGRCDKCKKELKAGNVAVKMVSAEPEVIWLKRQPNMHRWPDMTALKDKKLFAALKARVKGELKEEDASEYSEKLQNKKQAEGSPE